MQYSVGELEVPLYIQSNNSLKHLRGWLMFLFANARRIKTIIFTWVSKYIFSSHKSALKDFWLNCVLVIHSLMIRMCLVGHTRFIVKDKLPKYRTNDIIFKRLNWIYFSERFRSASNLVCFDSGTSWYAINPQVFCKNSLNP